MHGGVILFRGTGADALRYVESDRSRADDYYLGDATGISYTVLNASGETISSRGLSAGEYAGWVDWSNPDSGERMGRPRDGAPQPCPPGSRVGGRASRRGDGAGHLVAVDSEGVGV